MTIRQRGGSVLGVLALAALGWAAIVAMSGGVTLRIGPLVLMSRTPWRAAIAAIVFAAAARALLGAVEFRNALARVIGSRAARVRRAAFLLSLATFVIATAWNTRAAGGSDSSCYLLQADAFAHGRATLASPIVDPPSALPPAALAPGGFVPSPTPPFEAVPICPPGLALLMTPAIAIHRDAPFLVVPLFAALAVWLTFALGRAWADDRAGIWSAVLLACSPIFLYQSVQPMSDVPATALLMAALVAASHGGRRGAIVAGACASLAVLTRPNVALLVPLIAVLLKNQDSPRFPRRKMGTVPFSGTPVPFSENGPVSAKRDPSPFRKSGLSPFPWFVGAMVPAGLVMLALNAARYGAPLASGYGETGALFSWAHVTPNLARYPRWLLETHSPVLLLACAGPVILWRRGRRREAIAGTLAIAAVFATYVFYTVFDDWWYIRFLLPILPLILIFVVITAWRLAGRSAWLVPMGTLLLAGWFLDVAHSRHAMALQALESRFRAAGAYASRELPANAVVLAVQQSGSVRYHGGRATLAWDGIPANALDAVVAELRARGADVVLALEDAEERAFRDRFAGQRVGALDWPPAAELRGLVRVRFYRIP